MIISFIKNLSFQAKLLGIIVFTSLATLLITGYITFSNSLSLLEAQAYDQLNGFRYARLDNIQDYFKQSYQEALILSESPLFINVAKELIPAYEKLSEENTVKLTPEQTNKLNDYYKKVFIPELNKNTGEKFSAATFAPTSLADAYTSYYYTATNPYHFPDQSSQHKPKDGSEFTQVHNKYNDQIRRIAKAFDYEDIYLIDIKMNELLRNIEKNANPYSEPLYHNGDISTGENYTIDTFCSYIVKADIIGKVYGSRQTVAFNLVYVIVLTLLSMSCFNGI
jgi:hypothetical protein